MDFRSYAPLTALLVGIGGATVLGIAIYMQKNAGAKVAYQDSMKKDTAEEGQNSSGIEYTFIEEPGVGFDPNSKATNPSHKEGLGDSKDSLKNPKPYEGNEHPQIFGGDAAQDEPVFENDIPPLDADDGGGEVYADPPEYEEPLDQEPNDESWD